MVKNKTDDWIKGTGTRPKKVTTMDEKADESVDDSEEEDEESRR